MSNFERLLAKVSINCYDFQTWTSLLELADKQEDAEAYKKTFDRFLELFPFCYGYWKKYAELVKHKSCREDALKIYKRGVEAIPLSIDLWLAYTETFAETHHGDPDFENKMRAVYEQSIDMVGLEFRSDPLWEAYISWETSCNRYSHARRLYERLLATPTQLYFQNWDSFKRLVEDTSLKDLMDPQEIAPYHAQVDAKAAKAIEDNLYLGILLPGDDEPTSEEGTPRCYFVSFEEEETIKQNIVNSREQIYQASYQQIMKRWFFEEKIRRPYFHVKALDELQVRNWADYLSFEINELKKLQSLDEAQKSQLFGTHIGAKRVLVLFERCIIACALYEHMWIRYAKYLEEECKDIAGAYRVFYRACNIHLRNKPTIHFYWAMFLDRHSSLDVEKLIPSESSPEFSGWPLMPLQKQATFGTGIEQNVLPKQSVEVLTALEKRLPNSALVCARRCDFLRRSGASLIDLMMCLRSGVNRLRFAATEEYKRAYEVRGTLASISAQRLLVLAQQAKTGSAYLCCKMARMLLHLVDSKQGIPTWQLLLQSQYKSRNLKRTATLMEEDTESKKMKTDDDDDMPDSPPAIVCERKPLQNGNDEIKANVDELAVPLQLEVTVLDLPDARNLTPEMRKAVSGYQAALMILEEAFEYEPQNERIIAQWLDIIYQNRPMDVDAFSRVCDKAVNSSLLSEESKLAFMQRKLQMLEEFSSNSLSVADAYNSYLLFVNSMSSFRPTEGVHPPMYPTHAYQDLLNITPAAALHAKTPVGVYEQTPMPSYGMMNAMKTAPDSSASPSMDNDGTMHNQYTAGAYNPLARAQGDVSGLPPPVPVVPLMHPPMGDTSSLGGVHNEAWRKAAAAVGQQMAQPTIVEHI